MNHELQTQSRNFRLIITGRKTFEIRKNDSDFTEGDIITFKEVDERGAFTGRSYNAKVGYVSALKNVLVDCAIFSLLKEGA